MKKLVALLLTATMLITVASIAFAEDVTLTYACFPERANKRKPLSR